MPTDVPNYRVGVLTASIIHSVSYTVGIRESFLWFKCQGHKVDVPHLRRI